MSRLIVRNRIRQELATFAAANSVVFHDSIDVYLDVTDDTWITAKFLSDFVDKNCISGRSINESGTIEVIVFVKPGHGDAVAVGLCDKLQEHFLITDIDPVSIDSVTSASEFGAGDASGKYYACSIDISYFYNFTI